MKFEMLNKLREVVIPEKNNRIYGLDLLRFWAIIFVLLSHSRHFIEPYFGVKISYLGIGGYYGVEIFFVLSGFLIGGILIKLFVKKGNEISFDDVKKFWIRRWFRTLPNYYLVLLLCIIIATVSAKKLIFPVEYFLFFQNLVTPILGSNINYGQSWSLTVEEWFYMLTPLGLLLSFKLFNFNAKTKILIFIGITLLIYPLIKMVYVFVVGTIFGKTHVITFSVLRSVAILRLDAILFGVLVAFVNFYYSSWLVSKKGMLMWIGSSLFVCSLLFWILILNQNIESTPHYILMLHNYFISISICFVLPFLNDYKNARFNNLVSKWVVGTSVISYSLYLFHWSIVFPFVKLFSFSPIILLMLFWVLSYFVSIINYYFFESRMTKLREKF